MVLSILCCFFRHALNMGLSHFLGMVLSDHTGIHMFLFSSSTSGARQGLK